MDVSCVINRNVSRISRPEWHTELIQMRRLIMSCLIWIYTVLHSGLDLRPTSLYLHSLQKNLSRSTGWKGLCSVANFITVYEESQQNRDSHFQIRSLFFFSKAIFFTFIKWEIHLYMCTHWRLRTVCASVQSGQSLGVFSYQNIPGFFKRTAPTLIRVYRYAGWSDSLLGTHILTLVLLNKLRCHAHF